MNKKKLKKAALMLPLIIQICFLCWITFTRHMQLVDSDAAKLYTHMEAIWESRTLFVPDWNYITTMEADCALLMALPFYAITGDLFISFACADVVVILILVAMTFGLIARILPDKEKVVRGGVLGSLLILAPYSVGVLQYSNMLYLSGAQYCMKVVLPMMLIFLLLEKNPEKPKQISWCMLMLYLAGIWLTATSSGIYVAAMGLAPILLYYLFGWLKERCKITLYIATTVFGSVIATWQAC